jgi:hypothetical protein
VGRRSLAIKLLEEEPSAAQQVPLLISLAKGGNTSGGQAAGADAAPGGGEGAEDTLSRALRKAVDARDPDLVYLVLFAAYRSRPLPEFWKMVGPRPTAHNLFVKYTRVKVRGQACMCMRVHIMFLSSPCPHMLGKQISNGLQVALGTALSSNLVPGQICHT